MSTNAAQQYYVCTLMDARARYRECGEAALSATTIQDTMHIDSPALVIISSVESLCLHNLPLENFIGMHASSVLIDCTVQRHSS